MSAYERFRNLAGGIQATVVTVVALGGVWFAWLQYGTVSLSLSAEALGESVRIPLKLTVCSG